MGLAAYDVQGLGKRWSIFHDGAPEGDYETAEAAFEAAVAAASLALREGHEIRVTVKGQQSLDVRPLSSLMPSKAE